ncbi:MAG: hypothetical protein JXP48_07175 [Acidobacteria bacterium]|nr:hypothetical protein [Acidobacteriota bacterium]
MDIKKVMMSVVLCGGLAGTNVFAFSADGAQTPPFVQKRPLLGRMLQAHAFALELNLTGLQKAQIRDILVENRGQLLQAVRSRLQARLDLGNGGPESIADLANAQLQSRQLKKQILEQIAPVLNASQLALIQQRQQEREQRLRKIAGQLDARMGL